MFIQDRHLLNIRLCVGVIMFVVLSVIFSFFTDMWTGMFLAIVLFGVVDKLLMDNIVDLYRFWRRRG